MRVFRGMRTAALFVGSVVGAGFATGQELQLFFGGSGVASVAVAALFMAVCAFAFLEMGAGRSLYDPRLYLATDVVVVCASFAVYAAMIAAAEEVLVGWTGQAGLSLFLAVGVMLVTLRRIDGVSELNLVAVPLMAAVVVVVGVRAAGNAGGGCRMLSAFAYGGMNLLFSGALMMREGARLTIAERLVASVTAGGVLFLMMYFMWRAVGALPPAEMPFLLAAERAGLGTLASVALLLAILTTMASCAYLVTDRLTALTGDPAFAAPLTALLGVLTARFGFAPIVRTTYPIVSYLGLAATLAALALSVSSFLRSLLAKRKRRPQAP